MVLGATLRQGAAQENPVPSPVSPASPPVVADHFVGVWKLNTDKSSHSGMVSESVVIETQGSDFKFLYDWLAENGTDLHWWFVTDMKGGCVKETQVNGKPMASQSCITRMDSKAFVNDTKILKDEYKVSADGETLVVRTTFKLSPNGKKLHEQKLVFDRVARVASHP
jgi:hypothetical protein